MAKGPREKINQFQTQGEQDASSRAKLAKGGYKGRQERIKREAEQAELDSYKLSRKKF